MYTFNPASRVKQSALIGGVAFLAYNVLLFVIAGFDGHEAPFWMSYAFMICAFASIVINALLLRNRKLQPCDFMFGYPVLKHCAIFIGVEFVLSTLFMLLDAASINWIVAFVPQFLALAIHVILITSCFMAHDTIQEIDNKVKDATSYIKLLRVDVEMVAQKCVHPETKAAFLSLAEDVRYSDPMSNPCLFELEKQINLTVANADFAVKQNDYVNAMILCNQAKMLLMERNQKCKALK